MPLQACLGGDWVCFGMHQESLPMTTSERQERQGQFPLNCEECFSREVITTEQVWLFLQQARAYILVYHNIQQKRNWLIYHQQQVYTSWRKQYIIPGEAWYTSTLFHHVYVSKMLHPYYNLLVCLPACISVSLRLQHWNIKELWGEFAKKWEVLFLIESLLVK
jgi:hypothetical protein